MRWGIVGTGATAARFADACGRTGSARPVAVCSRSAETGQAFARAWGFEGVAEDAAALAARDDVDVVYVATPNHRHVDDVLAVIAAVGPGQAKSILAKLLIPLPRASSSAAKYITSKSPVNYWPTAMSKRCQPLPVVYAPLWSWMALAGS